MSDNKALPEQTPPLKRGTILGQGGSCFVSVLDETTVYKGYEIWVDGRRRSWYPMACEDSLLREALVYEHLGPHPQILGFYGRDEIAPGIHALRLERAPRGCVRRYIQATRATPPPERVRLRMSLDVARAVRHAHDRRVRHCDLSCRNFLLFDDDRVKVGDWGGALIEGHPTLGTPGAFEEMQYELPCRGRDLSHRPVLPRQIFALGSAVYEIMAWHRPFQGVSDDEVEQRYAREEFASLEGICVAETILNCWKEVITEADDVVKALEEQLSRR